MLFENEKANLQVKRVLDLSLSEFKSRLDMHAAFDLMMQFYILELTCHIFLTLHHF